ncbi:CLUMA_CG014686, isoform A [Clunio marinus]|uniref:CLUMA_CG014686, isoform A n=1 Tax=Clunio marinus TaxID=568069 RepID=A0A1J1IN04_9DIPT|nr:CLUMA_CG014686, isoform A [Clunio marinus]
MSDSQKDEESIGSEEQQDNKKDKKKDKKKERREKKKQKKENKTIEKIQKEISRRSSSQLQPGRRHSSVDQNLRYTIYFRPSGPQQSNSIKDLLPIIQKEKKSHQNHHKKKKNVTVSHESSIPLRDRDHLDAVDFLNRISTLKARESLLNLHHPLKKDSWFNFHSRLGSKTNKFNYHKRRCGSCLEVNEECSCDDPTTCVESQHQSDWATLVMPRRESPIRKEQSLEWLEELERKSKINCRTLVEEKFSKKREICCFPFNTFNIFSKNDIEVVDFYVKH